MGNRRFQKADLDLESWVAIAKICKGDAEEGIKIQMDGRVGVDKKEERETKISERKTTVHWDNLEGAIGPVIAL